MHYPEPYRILYSWNKKKDVESEGESLIEPVAGKAKSAHARYKNLLGHAWATTIGIVRSPRDLTIPPLNSFLREGLAQPPLSSTTFHDPETLSDVEPAGTSVSHNFVQIFWRRLGAEEFSLGP